MECFSIVLLVSMSVCATAFDSNCSIGDEDICSTVISNQLNLTHLKLGMDDIVSSIKSELHKNNEAMNELMYILQRNSAEEALKSEELRNCRTANDEKLARKQVLEGMKKEQMQRTQAKVDTRAQLESEVESLEKKKAESSERFACLKREIKQLDDLIANLTFDTHLPLDCADLQIKGETKSGVYTIHPYQDDITIEVKCDFDSSGGGWTVFLARAPQDNPLDFNVLWENYKEGFGQASGEYFLGLDYIHLLSSYYPTSLRFDAANFNGEERFAEYHTFKVDNEENKYQLTVDDYLGGSTMSDNLLLSSNNFFTTKDRDNDAFSLGNCATLTKLAQGGWWYASCGNSRLTGPLGNTNNWNSACVFNWDSSTQNTVVSLKTLTLKFRRHNFRDLVDVREIDH